MAGAMDLEDNSRLRDQRTLLAAAQKRGNLGMAGGFDQALCNTEVTAMFGVAEGV